MSLLVSRLMVDFGLVVLIWMVQLIIYPSFLFYKTQQLVKWHKTYTQRITLIVAPLMFAQTGIIITQVFLTITLENSISLILCLALWALTFFEAVPLHRRLENVEDSAPLCTELVRINKKRTALWTILFFISLFQYWQHYG